MSTDPEPSAEAAAERAAMTQLARLWEAAADTALSRRALSLLRAVHVGHGVLVCGCQPHLLVDGLRVCDSDAAPLIAAGLIAPDLPGQVGMRVLAVLTDAGRNALDRMVAA